ncbi:MAG: hypothetical protein M1826_007026 [Phylliscum demangeonii]|nr:MAG: hypothetical protein M1826_007026 [Phylliscum demangeonii]
MMMMKGSRYPSSFSSWITILISAALVISIRSGDAAASRSPCHHRLQLPAAARDDRATVARTVRTAACAHASASASADVAVVVAKRSIDDTPEAAKSSRELSTDEPNVQRRQAWAERMARIRSGHPEPGDLEVWLNRIGYERERRAHLHLAEEERMRTGEMSFEELEAILARQGVINARRRRNRSNRRQRFQDGTETIKDAQVVQTKRDANERARKARIARFAAGEPTATDRRRKEKSRLASERRRQKKKLEKLGLSPDTSHGNAAAQNIERGNADTKAKGDDGAKAQQATEGPLPFARLAGRASALTKERLSLSLE